MEDPVLVPEYHIPERRETNERSDPRVPSLREYRPSERERRRLDLPELPKRSVTMSVPYFKPARRPNCGQIREKIEEEFGGEIVIPREAKSSKKRLHAPADDCEEPRALCDSPIGGYWALRPLVVYPAGHKDWCSRCLVQMFPDRAQIAVARATVGVPE